MSVNLDINTLNWVKSEIDETLKQARQALEVYVEAPDDESQLRFCLNYIHQVYGTLQMVELYGASMLAEEMEHLTKAIIEDKVSNREDAFEVLMRGIIQLPDYLEHIQTGHDDVPVVLLPLLNDMRAARNEALLSENALFSPDMSAVVPKAAAPAEETDIQLLAKKLRHQYHLGLLDWFRDRDVAGGLKRISSVLQQLRSCAEDSELARLLWTAQGILEGLQSEHLETGIAVKLLMGQVDRQIKHVIDQGEAAFNTLPPDDLVKNLLYYVAQTEAGTPVVDEIKQAFKLEQAMPDAERLEQARAELTAPNAELMDTVSGVLFDDLTQIKDSLDVFVRTEERNVDVLKEMSLKFNQMADTLGMLGLGTQRKTIQEQVAVMQSMVDGQREMDESGLMNIASAILTIETSLKEPGNQVQSAASGKHADRMRDPEFRQLMTTVLSEARNELNKVKESVNDFSQSPKNPALLEDVPDMLDRIRGSLSMLNLERAEALIDSAEDYVRHKILTGEKIPNEEELDALADAISSIEYYMESLVDSWGHPTAILDVAEERLQLLGAFDAAEQDEASPSPLADASVTSKDATLIDMPDLGSGDIDLSLDDEDDTEVEIAAPELEDDDSIVLDSSGLELGDGLTLEGLDSESDISYPDIDSTSNDLAIESGDFEIDLGEGLPEAITNDTQEISIAEAFGVKRIGEALDLWMGDPHDSAMADLLQEVCSHVRQNAEAKELSHVVDIIKDMSTLIEKIQKQEISLDEEVKNTLYMTRDTLLDLLSDDAVKDKKKLDENENIEVAIEDRIEPEAVIEEVVVKEIELPVEEVKQPANSASSLADDLDDEIIEIFLEEAEEETGNISTLLPKWQSNPQDEECLKDMRRSFHTLKGSGRLVGALDLGEFAWAFENMLNRVLDKTVTPVEDMFVILDKANASLTKLLELFKKGEKPPQSIYTLMEFAEALSQGNPIDLQQLDSDMPDISQTIEVPAGMNDVVEIPNIDPALLEIYRKEINSHLGSLEKYIEAWNEDGVNEASHDLIRALHTLNGSSRTAGVSNLAELFGTLEKYAKYLQTNHLVVPQRLVDLVQESMDYTQSVASSLENIGETMPDDDALLARAHRAFDDLRFETPTMEMMIPAELSSGVEEEVETVEHIPSEVRNIEDDIVDYDEELVDIFLEEGTEILDESDHTINDWMQDVENRSHLEALQRQLHTLKGGARMAGIQAIGDLSHSIESMLTAVVEDQLSPSEEMFNVMQQAHDRLVLMLEQVSKRQSITDAPELIKQVEGVIAGESITEEEIDSAIQIDDEVVTETSENLEIETVDSIDNVVVDEDESIEIEAPEVSDNVVQLEPVKVEPEQEVEAEEASLPASITEETEEAKEIEAAPSRAVEARGREQVRVRADLLDNLVNFAGEVSIYRSRLEQQSNAFRYNLQELNDTIARLRGQLRQFEMEAEAQIQHRLEETGSRTHEDFDPLEFDRFTQMQTLSRGMLESLNDLDSLRGILTNLTRESETLLVQQARVNTELQEGLMRTRMVPFVGQVPRLRRIVRQTAQELNKKIELHIEGADNELDRNVLERILSPIEHMLRNAISHGIEKPKQRVAAGKPEQGNIYFAVAKEGSDIVVRVRDDGAGIDLDAIREKAISKGQLKPDAKISNQALLDFILESGFSTASEVTQISGRGVGMDVVNNEIKQLGGILNIDTIKGQGTSFSINLPLTLSITRALMVNVGDELFAIPLIGVEGVERVSNQELKKLHASENAVYRWLDEDSQFLHLGSVMGVCEPRLTDEEKHTSLLMVRSGDLHAAIQVEGLIGSREVVVKPVGPQLSTLRGISGATIMGDGRVVLILDLGVLIRLANMQREETGEVNTPVDVVVEERKPVVMVVDDSITVRKVTTRLLERNDMEAISAKDGVDALAQLQEVRPDVMLLDVEMPRMDGFELATNMRNDDSLKDIPIIMITSRTGEKHRERALSIGVNDYMGKPYNENELLESINTLIEK